MMKRHTGGGWTRATHWLQITQWLRVTQWLLATLWLSACSTQIITPQGLILTDRQPKGWADRLETLTQFDHWSLQGKLAVSQPDRNESAIINEWQQSGDFFHLQLSSAFLGLGSTQISGLPGGIALINSDGEHFYSTAPEALLLVQTGWQLPIASLPWWVKGAPEPASKAQLLFDQAGQLSQMTQHGWTIHFERYQQFAPSTPLLPGRITLTKADSRVRLAITAWQARQVADEPATP